MLFHSGWKYGSINGYLLPIYQFIILSHTCDRHIFQGHPATVTAVGNDDEDENVDVEGDTETTMYDIVYGGGGNGVWSGQQQHNRMRQHPMILHGGGFGRGGEYHVRFIITVGNIWVFTNFKLWSRVGFFVENVDIARVFHSRKN